MQNAARARLITRYQNRKLYDPLTKSYVTLESLARLIGAGQDVQVLDQKTGEDLTTQVLAQVIFEAVKERTASIPQMVLVRLIRLGMSPRSADVQPAPPAVDTVSRARDEAERIVAGLLQRGRLPLEEALALRQEIADSVHRAVGEAQRGLEARFHGLMEWTERESGVTPAIQALKEKLLTLDAYLGKRRAQPKPKRKSPARGRKQPSKRR
jgi:polyhydroxyalkanoate synthesis repressor PhaR